MRSSRQCNAWGWSAKSVNQRATMAAIMVQMRLFRPEGRAAATVRAAVASLGIGIFTLNTAASSFRDVPAGQWVEVPNTRLVDVAVQGSPGGSIRKITAWSGAAYDSNRNQVLVWGGGHSDYGGNEVYAFDLDDLTWRRLTEPSAADRSRAPLYPDGRPRARHTYNYIEYLPSRDRLVSFGGSGPYPSGGGEFTRDQAEFDPDSGRWQTSGRAAVPKTGNMIGAHARLDHSTGDVYFLGSQRASPMRYEPATDRWVQGWGTTHVRVHSTAAIDPDRRLLVVVGSGGDAGRGQLIAWRLDRPAGAGPHREEPGRYGDRNSIRAWFRLSPSDKAVRGVGRRQRCLRTRSDDLDMDPDSRVDRSGRRSRAP